MEVYVRIYEHTVYCDKRLKVNPRLMPYCFFLMFRLNAQRQVWTDPQSGTSPEQEQLFKENPTANPSNILLCTG